MSVAKRPKEDDTEDEEDELYFHFIVGGCSFYVPIAIVEKMKTLTNMLIDSKSKKKYWIDRATSKEFSDVLDYIRAIYKPKVDARLHELLDYFEVDHVWSPPPPPPPPSKPKEVFLCLSKSETPSFARIEREIVRVQFDFEDGSKTMSLNELRALFPKFYLKLRHCFCDFNDTPLWHVQMTDCWLEGLTGDFFQKVVASRRSEAYQSKVAKPWFWDDIQPPYHLVLKAMGYEKWYDATQIDW